MVESENIPSVISVKDNNDEVHSVKDFAMG
jgi:hypothetical protein